jgi:ABC-type taurine transport system ATPase subunit
MGYRRNGQSTARERLRGAVAASRHQIARIRGRIDRGQRESAPRQRARRVELRGVTAHYKGVAALSSINLTIAEGEFFSLLGPSGCGKTTTFNIIIIGGFAEPDKEDGLIQGRSARRIPAHRRPVSLSLPWLSSSAPTCC